MQNNKELIKVKNVNADLNQKAGFCRPNGLRMTHGLIQNTSLRAERSNPADENANVIPHYAAGSPANNARRPRLGGRGDVKTAFTLAEVLITLGIIGVVAAMTLPTLIQRQQEKEKVVKLKKSYSVLTQAFNFAREENGSPDNWGITSTYYDDDGVFRAPLDGGIAMANAMGKHMKILKRCDGTDECYDKNAYTYLGGDKATRAPQDAANVILNDGSMIVFTAWSSDCSNNTGEISNICGSLLVDVNGYKLPNQYGNDVFVFYLTKDAIIPWGSQLESGGNSFANKCDARSNSFESGLSCAGWVITNENMDYLRCTDLDWETKTKCN